MAANSKVSLLAVALATAALAAVVWGCGDAATGQGASADASADVAPAADAAGDVSTDATDATDTTDASADAVQDTSATDACAYAVLFDGGGCGAASCTTTTTVIDPASCGIPDLSTPAGKKAAQAFCDMLTPTSGDSRIFLSADGGGFYCLCCTG